MIQQFASVALFVLAAGCKPAPDRLIEVAHPVGVEFRLVMDADEQGTTEFLYDEKTLYLGPPQQISLSRLYGSLDQRGRPAIGFDFAAAEADRFKVWTGSIVGSQMAIVVNGRVVTTPHVNDPLSRGGQITGGRFGFTEEEVQGILHSVQPGQR